MNRRRRIALIDKITMEPTYYESTVAAARAAGISQGKLYNMAATKGLTNGKRFARFAEEYDPDETFDGLKHRPVIVTDIVTGSNRAFYSSEEAANAIFYSKRTVVNAICMGAILGRRYSAKWLR